MEIVAINRQDTPKAILTAISEKRNIPFNTVVKMMRYNVLTVKQLSQITGVSVVDIMNWTKAGKKTLPKITEVGVFVEFDAAENRGPLCILRDERTENIIKDSLIK